MSDKAYHHGNLGNELIEAGIEIINEEGLKSFSLRKVAAKCDVSHAAPYSHFKNIDELISAIGKHITEQFMDKLRASIYGREANQEAIIILGEAYIDFFIGNPQYFQFLFYHSGITIDLDNENSDDYPPFSLFRKVAYQSFDKTSLPQEDYSMQLMTLWSIVHGVASLLTNNRIRYSGDWRHIFRNKIKQRREDNENNCTRLI